MAFAPHNGIMRYNSLPILCQHTLDFPEEYYRKFGVRRVHGKDNINIREINPGDFIFVKTDLLDFFWKHISIIPSPFTLVTGTSDITPENCAEIVGNEKIISWAGMNLPLCSSKILQIPVGFAEHERPYGDETIIGKYAGGMPWAERPIDILVTPMSDTSKERSGIDVENFHHCKERLSYPEYLSLLGQAKYVVCPRGNGVDTLRVWETLVAGARPVVQESILDKLYGQCGCLIVKDWTDINQMTAFDRIAPLLHENAVSSMATRSGIFFTEFWFSKIIEHHNAHWSAHPLHPGTS